MALRDLIFDTADTPMPADETDLKAWSKEVQDAFKAYRWLFHKINTKLIGDRFIAKVYHRDDLTNPFATIERVSAGWKITVAQPGLTMVFNTVGTMVAWLLKDLGY